MIDNHSFLCPTQRWFERYAFSTPFMETRTLGLSSVFLSLVILLPVLSSTALIQPVSAEGECCESQEVDLFLVSSDGLTPFEIELDDLQTKSLSTSVPSEESIGTWSIQPGYHGDYEATTWRFSIHYEVSNAGGVQINATAEVKIGPNTFTAQTPAQDAYVPSGAGTLDIDIEIESGSVVSSDIVSIELILSSMVFVVPSTDASIQFLWGDEEHDSKLSGNLPLLDIDLQAPLIDGRTIHIPAVLRSGFGQKLLENGELFCRVQGELVQQDPVKTPSGQDVKATWSWTAPESFSQNSVTVQVEYSLQSSTGTWTASSEFEIELEDGSGSSTFYSKDEPLRTAHSSAITFSMDADIQKDDDEIILTRNTELSISDDMAYWLRWGVTNQGAEGLDQDSIWSIFDGGFSDEQYNDKVIDNNEIEKMTNELQSGALMNWFMEGALQVDPEALLGGFDEFYTFQVRLEFNDDMTVSRNPVSLFISTTQRIAEGEYFLFIQQFILPQIDTYWRTASLSVSLYTDSQSGLIGIDEKASEEIGYSHERHLTKEVFSFQVDDILEWSRLDIQIKPSTNPLHGPLPLFLICTGLILVMFMACFMLSRQKTRKPLYLESILIPLVFLAYWYAYPLENLGALMGVVGGIWMVTTIITPKRIGSDVPDTSDMPEVPTIACPKCTTVNPVVSEIRPLRLPCGGCGRILKIVG